MRSLDGEFGVIVMKGSRVFMGRQGYLEGEKLKFLAFINVIS